MSFKNPLAHVSVVENLTVKLGGKDVPFERIGLDEITALANRFDFLMAQLRGEDVDFSTVSKADQREMACSVIALAIAPDAVPGAEYDAMMDALRSVKPFERDLALASIMTASFPEVSEGDESFSKSAPKKPAKRATTKAPAKGRASTR